MALRAIALPPRDIRYELLAIILDKPSRVNYSVSKMRTLLTAEQLAQRWSTTREAIYARCARRQVPFTRLGPRQIRFDEEEIKRFEQAGTVCSSAEAAANAKRAGGAA